MFRAPLLALAATLVVVAASCADCDRIPCDLDTDCGQGGVCVSHFCEAAPAGEGEGSAPGEGEGTGPSEGEGTGPSEGEGTGPSEGEGAGPGEGEGTGPGEGEGVGPGEGEGASPGEGEGASPGEGEGEGEGAGCTSDGQCAGTERCDISSGQCVQCLLNADCPSTAPVCGANHVCHGCSVDADCPGEHCNFSTGACVACTGNAQCTLADPHCDLTSDTCGGCVAESDCTPFTATPHCNVNDGSCVQCRANSDCTASSPHCDLTTGTCGACVVDGECSAGTFCEVGGAGCFGVPQDTELFAPFDNDHGLDESPNHHPATAFQDFSYVVDRHGLSPKAIDMTNAGSSTPTLVSYANIPQMTGSFTLGIWLKAPTGSLGGTTRRIAGQDGFFELYTNAATSVSAGKVNANTIVGPQATANGVDSNWHFFLARVTDLGGGNSKVEMFRDAALAQSLASVPIPANPGTCRFEVGPIGNGNACNETSLIDGDSPLPAFLDDLRLYHRALNDAEIKALFHEGGF